MLLFMIMGLSLPQVCAPTSVVSLSGSSIDVDINPCRNTYSTIYTVHVYRTRGCVCVCFRPSESKSNRLPLLPLQDVHLCLPLWQSGLRWYICICLSMWAGERMKMSRTYGVGAHTGLQSRHGGHMPSRV